MDGIAQLRILIEPGFRVDHRLRVCGDPAAQALARAGIRASRPMTRSSLRKSGTSASLFASYMYITNEHEGTHCET
jgi:hypothetical protein